MSTGIQWTDETWNPIRGCSLVSAGCKNCYAMGVAARFSGPGLAYEGLARRRSNGKPQWTGEVRVIESHMNDPLKWRKPRRIFVNSMSDLFHENVSNETILRVWEVMEKASHHTFQILTKRPARMLDFLGGSSGAGLSAPPLPNVWLGVSIENQETADERIPLLLQTPAAVRFISAEPLLGPIDISLYLEEEGYIDDQYVRPLDWVIVGGESGRDARPCDLEWIRDIRAQCGFNGVACFVKQLGKWVVGDHEELPRIMNRWLLSDGSQWAPGVVGEHNRLRPANAIAFSLMDAHGGDISEWPEDLRIREFPTPSFPDKASLVVP
jgi:protein gp37